MSSPDEDTVVPITVTLSQLVKDPSEVAADSQSSGFEDDDEDEEDQLEEETEENDSLSLLLGSAVDKFDSQGPSSPTVAKSKKKPVVNAVVLPVVLPANFVVHDDDYDDENEYTVPFAIPKNVTPVNEVQEMVSELWNTTSANKKLFIYALFDLLAGHAGDSVTGEQSVARYPDLCTMAGTNFIQSLDTYPKKNYIIDNLMLYLPNKTWPEEFVTYSKQMMDITPPDTFLTGKTLIKKSCTMGDNSKKLCYFGSKVWEAHQRAKGMVNSHLNPHWKPSVLNRSGTSVSSVLLGIRKHVWNSTILPKAKACIDNSMKYTSKRLKEGKTVRYPVLVDEANSKDQLVQEEVNRLTEKGFETWCYPREWLCFMLLGKPADINALKSYSSGKPKRKVFTLDDIKNESLINCKQARRLLAAGEKVVPDTVSSTSATGSTKTSVTSAEPFVHHILLGGTKSEAAIKNNTLVKSLEKMINTYKDMITDQCDNEVIKVKLKQCRVDYIAALEWQIAAATQPIVDSPTVFDTPKSNT
jgi:hypothetical protein